MENLKIHQTKLKLASGISLRAMVIHRGIHPKNRTLCTIVTQKYTYYSSNVPSFAITGINYILNIQIE